MNIESVRLSSYSLRSLNVMFEGSVSFAKILMDESVDWCPAARCRAEYHHGGALPGAAPCLVYNEVGLAHPWPCHAMPRGMQRGRSWLTSAVPCLVPYAALWCRVLL